MKISWRRKLIGGFSLGTALFIFQACYGTPHDFGLDVYIEGQVKSEKSNLPVKGIRVSIADMVQYVFTDESGKFSLYTETAPSYKVKFEDTDAGQNGSYIAKDTTLTNVNGSVYLHILLKEN
jgi:putative lipoprotein (rSAM/lipoprotein system)